jgi:hypothetical protein
MKRMIRAMAMIVMMAALYSASFFVVPQPALAHAASSNISKATNVVHPNSCPDILYDGTDGPDAEVELIDMCGNNRAGLMTCQYATAGVTVTAEAWLYDSSGHQIGHDKSSGPSGSSYIYTANATNVTSYRGPAHVHGNCSFGGYPGDIPLDSPTE